MSEIVTLVKGWGPDTMAATLVLEGTRVMLRMWKIGLQEKGPGEPGGKQEWEVGPQESTPVHLTDHSPFAEHSEKGT